MKKIPLIITTFATMACTSKPTNDIPSNTDKVNKDYLILVNKQNPIKDAEIPRKLEHIDSPAYREVFVINIVKEAYQKFLGDSSYNFMLFSGFRSISYQEEIYASSGFNNDLVAKPYESEHHTGLAVDVSTSDMGLTEALGTTPEGIYLKNNIHKYGFILRYPQGKKNITGYDYEPWHIRFVGIEHAKFIFENNLTLEEYLMHHLN